MLTIEDTITSPGVELGLDLFLQALVLMNHLLTAVNAVQPLLQLSEGVTLQAFGPFLRNCGQRLPKK